MDLSKFIDSKAFNTGVAIMIVGTLIIALGGYAWEKTPIFTIKIQIYQIVSLFAKGKSGLFGDLPEGSSKSQIGRAWAGFRRLCSIIWRLGVRRY